MCGIFAAMTRRGLSRVERRLGWLPATLNLGAAQTNNVTLPPHAWSER